MLVPPSISELVIPHKASADNGLAKRAVKSVRLDLLNHIRVRDVDELQSYLGDYRTYYTFGRGFCAHDL